MRPLILWLAAGVASLLCSFACGDSATVMGAGEATAPGTGNDATAETGDETTQPLQPATDVVSVDDGAYQRGEAPVPEAMSLPAIVRITGPEAVTNGGVAVLQVELSAHVENPTFVVSRAGDSGFHSVPSSDSDGDGVYPINVQIAAEADVATLTLLVALMDDEGKVGDYSAIELPLVQSGTGDVKVTLTFERVHDLDLYVIEPNGEEISYLNDASATGGKLDLDSGANCMPGGTNSENVFWPPAGAPSGEYRVSVHNFQQCTPGDIAFTVRVVHDGIIDSYAGRFADGTEGSVAEVATFRR